MSSIDIKFIWLIGGLIGVLLGLGWALWYYEINEGEVLK